MIQPPVKACPERAKHAKSSDTIKWWPYTAFFPTDIFLLGSPGEESKGKRALPGSSKQCVQEGGWRIRFAKVSTFAFPTNSYSMQSKFPLQSCLGCTVANGSTEQAALKPEQGRSHHTSSSASLAIGVLTWGPESLCSTALNPADPRQSSEKHSNRKKEDVLFSGTQPRSRCCNKM